MRDERVGVLALQGGYQRHIDCLDRLAIESRLVRCAADLEECTALILPGGESTSMTRLIEARGLLDALTGFAQTHPVLGTCAGLILMARSDDDRVASLGLLDVRVERNAYGRQTHSFRTDIPIELEAMSIFSAVFIRAPRIVACGPGVDVLARHDGMPVLVAQGRHMGMSFHPELTGDPRVHAEWLRRARVPSRETALRQVSA
ncbi:MAG TPA: pyridoxal 5'-phosphate synthase glutaminase subunit PdxT [Gammaproteobacteria bacterium]